MDPIKAQKLRAMNLYKKSDPLFQSLIIHSLIALACSLFCSYSYSFPNSFYTIKHLVFYSLPNTWSWFLNPSCLFMVVNFIVVFLIGESRLSGKQSSPAADIYDEYVARAQTLRRRPSTAFQEMDDPKEENANGIEDHKQVDEVLLKEENDGHDEDFEECEEIGIENEKDEEEEEEEKEKEKEEEIEHELEQEQEQEEAVGMPAEELNKRVEDFIARVNKQRWLEARFLVNL